VATIHAEITAGGESIVLVAGGVDVYSIAEQARHLKALTPLFSASDPAGALTVPATWPAVVQLQAAFGDWFVPGPNLRAWIQLQAEARTNLPAFDETLVPRGLTPYSWQVSGARMIAAARTNAGALITDEPGTGKTITAILGLAQRQLMMGGQTPVVVVCPASVIDSWVEAWRAWAPAVSVCAWRGPKRKALAGSADVYVASYETARADSKPVKGHGPLVDLAPAALVIDECHFIKNARAERSKAVRALAKSARCVVALSGTPITHHPGDLWSALACLEPHAYPSSERWVNRYCHVVPGDYKDEILGLHPHTEPEFRLSLLGAFRRVAKADVLTQLPPKVYSVRTVDLPAAWRKSYDDFEARMLAELPDGQELSVMDTLSVLTHSAALASAAGDVRIELGPDIDERTGEAKRHVHVDLKAPSWKVDALLEVLEERPSSPVLAFAPSRQLMTLAGQAAGEAGLRVGYVVGGQSAGERTRYVEAFQAGQLDLMCATTGAGGVGLTLTAASTVVFLQRPWSLVESLQAEDRAHRIGSEIHDSIEVVDIVARDTVDTRVRAVLRERAGQLADLVQDPRIVTALLGGASVTHTERKAS
jgi:SNF2 family DNA or RNA helicase